MEKKVKMDVRKYEDENIDYSTGNYDIGRRDQSVLKELKGCTIPDNIKENATEMFNQVSKGGITRRRKRLELIYASVFHSYQEIGLDIDPLELAKIMGLEQKYIRSAIQNFKLLYPQYKTKHITPLDLVDEILDQLKFVYDVNTIAQLYNFVIKRSDILNRSQPQSVACALIYYQLISDGYRIDINSLSSISPRRCPMTILKLSNEIQEIMSHSSETEQPEFSEQ